MRKALRKHGLTITVFSIIAVVLVLAVAIYFTLGKPSTSLYFNLDSDFPDPSAGLKNEFIGANGLHILDVGGEYEVSFTVESTERASQEYVLIIDSSLITHTGQFTLSPGESRRFSYKLTPGDADKWEYAGATHTRQTRSIDLVRDSFIADRIDFDQSIIVGDLLTAYAYAPVKTDMPGFGEVLNLNMTLEELKVKPYVRSVSTVDEKEYSKTVTNNTIKLEVAGNTLKYDYSQDDEIYDSKNQLFRIIVHKKDNGMAYPGMVNDSIVFSPTKTSADKPLELNFWYRIR
jgi:hypothetical protein